MSQTQSSDEGFTPRFSEDNLINSTSSFLRVFRHSKAACQDIEDFHPVS